MPRLAALLPLIALFACGPKGPPPVLPDKPTEASAREILRHNCGTCHRGDLPDHNAAAVAIFDLQHEEWSARLTPAQLDVARTRLSATDAEEAHFDAWARQESGRRSSP